MKTTEKRTKCELLKTSWTYQTKEYFKTSTLHGMRYINEDGRPFCEKWVTTSKFRRTEVLIHSSFKKFQEFTGKIYRKCYCE